MIPTEPGIYHDLPFEDYRAIKAFNSSLFKHPTNRHLKAALDGKIPDKDSQALRFGREVHCRLLEPERYRQDVLVASTCCAVKRDGEVCASKSASRVSSTTRNWYDAKIQAQHMLASSGWTLRETSSSGSEYYIRKNEHIRLSDHDPNAATADWLREVNGLNVNYASGPESVVTSLLVPCHAARPLNFWYCGIKGHAPDDAVEVREYVRAEEAEAIEQMAESLHSHEVMNLFRCPGWCELTVVFEFDSHLLKARTDKFSAIGPEHFGGRPTIIDIKKGIAGKLDRDTCRKKILEYGWHRQAAIYVDALEYHGHKDVQFVWIFIEDGPPFDINIVVASSTDIEIGRSEYRSALRSYATAVKQGKYLGYVYSIKAIEPGALPDWYVDRWERAHKQGDNGADYEPVASGDGF